MLRGADRFVVNLDDFASSLSHLKNFEQIRHTDKLCCCSSHSLSKHPSREWDDTGDTERDWHYGDTGYLSRAHSSTSLQVGWLFAKEKEDENNSESYPVVFYWKYLYKAKHYWDSSTLN